MDSSQFVSTHTLERKGVKNIIDQQEIRTLLDEAAKKHDELYAANLAAQEASIDDAVRTRISDVISKLTSSSPRVIAFHEYVFEENPLLEVMEKVAQLGLMLERNYSRISFVGKLTF